MFHKKLSKYSEDRNTSSFRTFSETTLKMLTKPTTSSSAEISQEVWIVSHADEQDETGTYFYSPQYASLNGTDIFE